MKLGAGDDQENGVEPEVLGSAPGTPPPWKGDRGGAAYRTGEPARFSSDRAVNTQRTNSPVDKRPDEPS